MLLHAQLHLARVRLFDGGKRRDHSPTLLGTPDLIGCDLRRHCRVAAMRDRPALAADPGELDATELALGGCRRAAADRLDQRAPMDRAAGNGLQTPQQPAVGQTTTCVILGLALNADPFLVCGQVPVDMGQSAARASRIAGPFGPLRRRRSPSIDQGRIRRRSCLCLSACPSPRPPGFHGTEAAWPAPSAGRH